MAKAKSQATQIYHDDPDTDDVSMHTTRSDYEYEDVAEPPSYNESEAAASSSTQQSTAVVQHPRAFGGIDPYPPLSLTRWPRTRDTTVSTSSETTFRMDARLGDPNALETYIKTYITEMPPRPFVRILGQHTEERYNASSKKYEKQKITDFDFSLSLQQYLNPDFRINAVASNGSKVHRGSWRKTRANGHTQDIEVGESEPPSLQDWCRDFCNSKTCLKTFRIQRQVTHLKVDNLRSYIERSIRATHYHGHLGISLPTHEKNIDIYNPHWINRARVSWIRYIFYVTFLWIITWPILFFMTKRWSVYDVRWQWARWHDDHEQQRTLKTYASISEEDWAAKYCNLIQSLVLEKFEGDASHFPPDVPEERVQRGVRTRMQTHGNPNVEAAVGFIQSGVTAWNDLSGRRGRPLETWGGDS